MRILQIVTYVSPNAEYGGPLRVALNQARELKKQGHEVLLAGAAGGFGPDLPKVYDGVRVKLFRARTIATGLGFAGKVSPRLLAWIYKAARSADVIHIHTGRDLISLPACVVAGISRTPTVIQTHGMIDSSTNILARPLDLFLTRPALRKASAVLHLTEKERADLKQVVGESVNYRHLPNGVCVPDVMANEQIEGPSQSPEVLYLARMHSRKRPQVVVNAALALKDRWPKTRFTLIGPDEGEAEKIQNQLADATLEVNVRWVGPLPTHETAKRMCKASIFVLPSLDEPFGMSAAEAMAVGLPVIVTDTCGLASIIRKANAGIVCDSSQVSFTNAINRLLENPRERTEMGKNGRKAIKQLYSVDKVTSSLLEVYADAVCGKRRNNVS